METPRWNTDVVYRCPMQRSMSLGFILCLGLTGCGDDGGGAGEGSTGGGSTTDMTTSSSTTAEASSSAGETSTGGDSSTSGGSSSSSSSGSTGTVAPPVDISGQVSVFRTGDPVADGEVCWVEDGIADPCTTTDDAGAFVLTEVPGEIPGALRFIDDQIVPFAIIMRTADQDVEIPAGFAIDPPEVQEAYFQQAGIERVEGSVTVTAQGYPTQAGYEIKLLPDSGVGPFYYGDSPGEIDPKLTATAGSGVGLFLNVLPQDAPFEAQVTEGKTLCEQPHFGGTLDPWWIPPDVEAVYVGYDCE